MPAPTIPTASTFTFLAPLHPLLLRLLVEPTASHAPPSNAIQAPNNHINPKELATAASSILSRIQNARATVAGMEGMQMGIVEQEELIRALEERVRGQREMMRGMVGKAGRVLEQNTGEG